MSTFPCLLIPSFPSRGPPLLLVPWSPLYMLYTPSCWHMEKKQHLRVNEDMLTGKHREKGLSFLCPAVVAEASHLCKLLTFLQNSEVSAASETVPCPPLHFLERLQHFKTQSPVAQSPSLQKTSFKKTPHYNVTTTFGNKTIKNIF